MNSYLIKKGNKLITFVIFGGIYMKPGIPIFEFEKMTIDLDVNRIYIRDLEQCFYTKGIIEPSIEKNFIDVIENLERILKPFKNNKIIFIGNSSGAYASILFGNALRVDKIIAFSPQTFLDKKNRKKYGDNRFITHISRIYESHKFNRYFLDLNFIDKTPVPIDVHYSKIDKLDSLHAERIAHFVNLFPYDFGNHENLVRKLKDSGKLKEILNAEIT